MSWIGRWCLLAARLQKSSSIRAGQIGLKNRPTDRVASQTLPISGEEQLGNSQLT
jgi:hypothetical protein